MRIRLSASSSAGEGGVVIVTLLVSTGAAWEPAILSALNGHPKIALLKRCVDVEDLLAAALTGQAEVAVVTADLPGLDASAVARLGEAGVRLVSVAADVDGARPAADRIGIRAVVAPTPSLVVEAVLDPTAVPVSPPSMEPTLNGLAEVPTSVGPPGRVIAVWGPAGAPGRTTLASALGAELARRSLTTVLIDADPYGGTLAQQLGVLDEVSGLLAAARLVAGGGAPDRLARVQRRLSDRLAMVTGLPRGDRWAEVRPGALEELVGRLRSGAQVVVDTGFSLEEDPAADIGIRPQRNGLTREAIELADEIVVVGAADPVGLARLARGLHDLREVAPTVPLRVCVNRMRPTLGWRENDVSRMLADFGAPSVSFLPDDQPAVDRALVAGRSLIESGESGLTRAVAGLVDRMADRASGRSGAEQ